MRWWQLVVGVLLSLLVMWLVLVLVMWRNCPEPLSARQVLRLLPDLIRLVSRLARDDTLPRGVRVRLFVLLAYLLLPFDLIPDFIPVLGYADDVIVISLVLRSVVHRSGVGALQRHWPGTLEGFAVVRSVAGLDRP